RVPGLLRPARADGTRGRARARLSRLSRRTRRKAAAHYGANPTPVAAAALRGRGRQALAISSLLPDFRDRSVEHDVGVLERQLVGLRQGLDLVISHEQNRGDARLPADEELLPERVVIGLTRLGAEDRQLTLRRLPLDEVLRRGTFHCADLLG